MTRRAMIMIALNAVEGNVWQALPPGAPHDPPLPPRVPSREGVEGAEGTTLGPGRFAFVAGRA